jgi:uncharacterized RDD family membrane protein YckC
MNTRYAGFWVRFVATLIDSILLGLISGVLSFALSFSLAEGANEIISLLANIIGLVISIGYYVVYQQKNGQTIGKKVMNIKVVDYNGKTPTMFSFFLREIIGKTISGLILFIGYFMVIWDKRKQALHDKIAGTFVVYADQAADKLPTPSPTSAEATAGGASS